MAREINTKYVDCTVECSCGNTFTVKSTTDKLHIEVCDKCHPAFTGAQTRSSKSSKVAEFNRKYGFDKENK